MSIESSRAQTLPECALDQSGSGYVSRFTGLARRAHAPRVPTGPARRTSVRQPGRVRLPRHARAGHSLAGSCGFSRDQSAILREVSGDSWRLLHPRTGSEASDRVSGAELVQRTIPVRPHAEPSSGERRRHLDSASGRDRWPAAPSGNDGSKPLWVPPPDSPEQFFKEHSYGFGRTRDGHLISYEVRHPLWSTYRNPLIRLDWDFAAVYGDKWSILRDQSPVSLVLAVGSEVAVYPKGVFSR